LWLALEKVVRQPAKVFRDSRRRASRTFVILTQASNSVNVPVYKFDSAWYTCDMKSLTVVEKMRRVAKRSGLTLQEIGDKMGYQSESARQAVWNLLNRKNVSVTTLKRFAKSVGVDAGDLL